MNAKLKTIGGSLMVVIPADIVRQGDLKPDQSVNIAYTEGKVVIEWRPSWASFFARDHGIPPDFEFERVEFEDRDTFGLKAAK